MAAPWATPTEVAEITGQAVTDEQVASAQGVVELFVGRTAEETALIPVRDQGWLRRAVAYQAAWALGQPDLLTRTELDQLHQDGVTASFRPDSHLLAPLARRALKRLRWRGNRSVYTESTLGAGSGGQFDYAAEGVVAVHDYPWDRWHREA